MTDPAVLSRSGRLAVMQRHHGPGDPRVVELRREVAADAIARYVKRVVDEAPARPRPSPKWRNPARLRVR